MSKLRDVAEAAGVSVAVASRALNDDQTARISPQTVERVKRAAAELDYRPNHRARALRLNKAGAIALVVPTASNAIFTELLGGVQDVCIAEGVSIFLCEIESPINVEQQLLNTVGHGRVDAVLLQRSAAFSDGDLRKLIDVELPVLLVNSSLPGRYGAVTLDDPAGILVALNHLRGLGHSRIAYIGGGAWHDAAARRREAFLRSMDPPQRPEWIVEAGWEAHDGRRAMHQILAGEERPTAVVVASANAAVGALAAARDGGVKVPQQMSIVGIHDTWMCEFTEPQLTSVSMPLRELGRTASRELLEHLKGGDLTNQALTHPEPRLIRRSSTAAPPS